MNRQAVIYGSVGLGVVIFLVLYSMFAYSPLANKLVEKKQQLSQVQKQYEEEQALIVKQDEFGERASKVRIEKERLVEQLPQTGRMPELLKAITLAATECRLKHIKFTPLPLIEKEGYFEQRIQLAVTCRYHTLGAFISKLASHPRLINTEVLEIQSDDKTGKNDSIKVTLMLVTYVKPK